MNKFIIMILVLFMLGCTSTTTREYNEDVATGEIACDAIEGQTQEQLDECYQEAEEEAAEDKEYRRLDRQQLAREKLYAMIYACRAAPNLSVVYVCHICSSMETRKMNNASRNGGIYIPRGARPSDFYCVNTGEFMRQIQRGF